jgi:hypothetical protein
MSKARDISNLFSASTDVATDAEVTSAIATHASNTTNRHYKAGNSASRPGSPNVGDIYTNTETGFIELYESTGWSQVGAIASAPSSVVATNQGSGRAYNDGQASVAFSAGTVAGKTYTVTSSPGSYTNTGSASPVVVTGLQSSTQYTYTVAATNNYGQSAASAASAGVTATTAPQEPTIGTATGADQSATLTFTAGSTGGSAITNYKYSTDNSTYTAFEPAQTSSPLTISGLTDGQSYSFYLKAVNANGDSAASAESNSALVGLIGDFESIATVTASGNETITFNSIPSTYTHLQLRILAKTNRATYTNDLISLRFNGDTGSNYSGHLLAGHGSTVTAEASTSSNKIYYGGNVGGSTLPAQTYGAAIIDILDYKDTNKYKTTRSLSGYDNNGAGTDPGIVSLLSGSWRNTAAINSITLLGGEGSVLLSGSTVALYGIRSA